MRRIAVLFSGQGSQYPGMGKWLFDRHDAVKTLFATASETLDLDMARLCFEGSSEELSRTENTQPALLLVSVAAYRTFRAQTGLRPAFMAGHSLGELSALVAADALSLEDGLRLARRRGQAMARCTRPGEAGMYAVTKLHRPKVDEVCAAVEGFGTDFVVANVNAPGQVVLSGRSSRLAAAAEPLKQAGATVIPLKVSGPFHSPFMAPAAEALAEALAGIAISRPAVPVIANVGARPHGDGAQVAEALVRQITSPVLWADTMAYLRDQGVDLYLEAGPREVLKKLALANVPGAKAYALDERGDEAAMQQDLAADVRAVRERPTVVGKCLAIAVCTRNSNWNEEEYQAGVVEPYRELQAMQARLEQEGIDASPGEMKRAIDLLGRIFSTKRTPPDERAMRLAHVVEATGTANVLGDYVAAASAR
jgi:[acyl-carrier-protein] S-malonyltransferase